MSTSDDNKYKSYEVLEHIKQTPSEYYFIYVTIIIFSIYICGKININAYFIIVCVAGILYLVDLNRYNKKETSEEIIRDKLNSIDPHPNNFWNHPDLIDLFYNINEYNDRNEKVFGNVINHVDGFLEIYNNITQISTVNCGKEYDIAFDRYRDALNSLNSIIYSLDANHVENYKLNKAIEALKKFLENYLKEIEIICKKVNCKTKLDYTKKLIGSGPLSYNYFELPLKEKQGSNYFYDLY